MKKRWFILIALIIMLVIGIFGGYLFFRTDVCQDLDCFNKHLLECSRATYLNKGSWVYEYSIKGIKGIKEEKCIVDVKLVFVGLENKFDSIVDKSMRCSIPLRRIDLPESNMEYCSGPLKENMQYLVIQELYQYTTQNMAK